MTSESGSIEKKSTPQEYVDDYLIFDEQTEVEKSCWKCHKVTKSIFAETCHGSNRKSFCSFDCFESYLSVKIEKPSEYHEPSKVDKVKISIPKLKLPVDKKAVDMTSSSKKNDSNSKSQKSK